MEAQIQSIIARDKANGAARTRIVSTETETLADGTTQQKSVVWADVDHLARSVERKPDYRSCNPTPLAAKYLKPGCERVTDCLCNATNAVPQTLPWQDAIAYDQTSVDAICAIFDHHTPAMMAQMLPYFQSMCVRHEIAPNDVFETLSALQNIFVDGNQNVTYGHDLRTRALLVALEMYGAAFTDDPAKFVANGRKIAWTRLAGLFAEGSLSVLGGTAITGSAAAATYMTGAVAAANITGVKSSATLALKAKSVGMAATATVGAAVLGATTGFVAVGSYLWWLSAVNAFRDTWDNEFAKDAYMFHRLRHHQSVTDYGGMCNHANGAWTTPTSSHLNWRRNAIAKATGLR